MSRTGFIYGLFDVDGDDVLYVGSTWLLRKRISAHKLCCYKETHKHYNFVVYQHIRDNGGFEKFEFRLLEEVEVEDNLNARNKIEQEYIDHYGMENLLNERPAYITEEQRVSRNKKYDKERNQIRKHDPVRIEQNKLSQRRYQARQKEKNIIS